MPRTLVISNDFPPRKGGIQTFVAQLLTQADPTSIVVFASNWPGAASYDATLSFQVIRTKTKILLPTPIQTRRAIAIAQKFDCDQVLFGALAPLGIMSPALKRAGIKQIAALTHGHEAGWAKVPLLRFLLKLSARRIDLVTYLTQFTKNNIIKFLNPKAELIQLTPAVDHLRYHPVDQSTQAYLKAKWDLADKDVVLGLSRLMPRKGFDQVIKVLPKLVAKYPNLVFVIAGGGPDKNRLVKLASRYRVDAQVKFLGSIDYQDLPEVYQLADIFTMPCRSRFGGLDVEGFGIVYLEAAASGLPVIAGNSGGAVEAVLPGKTGELATETNLVELLDLFLSDKTLRTNYGNAGREWVVNNFQLTNTAKLWRRMAEIR